MNQKKLQKLCYYAQSWYLALNDVPLFHEKFEGWTYGPVCRNLWHSLELYSSSSIPKDILQKKAKKILNKEDLNFLNEVWDTYGKFTGTDLGNQTHKEIPWLNSRKGLSECSPGKNIISEDDMRTYYSNLESCDGIDETGGGYLKIDCVYSRENQKHLRQALKDFEEGNFEEHELIEVDEN